MAKSKAVCEILTGVRVGMGARVIVAGVEFDGYVTEVTAAYVYIQTISFIKEDVRYINDKLSVRKNFYATSRNKFRLVNGCMANFPENKVLFVCGDSHSKHL